VILTECPQSFIRPESLTLLEEHHVWRMSGQGDLRDYPAKSVEAFTLLESELKQETQHGQE
jgi:hypothetical protein